ncbi:hypothetical protein BDY24DRAFT_162610 [Mrakia frigida]|uniref:uncharacterized protein n=1 Tax=Mrakia frigida TaxID=29902 RepID=UPI003FCBF514
MSGEREEEENQPLDDSRRYRDDQGSSGSTSTFSQQFQPDMETSAFSNENRSSSWETGPYYQGGSSRQLPLLPTPLDPPPPGLVFAPPPPTQQPSSHHDFLLDMMHRSSNFYPQPPQFAVPPQLPPPPPPPPPPLPRREVDPLQLQDYQRFHSLGAQPLTSPPEASSGSERNLRGSISYPHLGGPNVLTSSPFSFPLGALFVHRFDSINLQSPYPYSPTHPQISSGSSSASSSYFPSQGGSGSNYSPYPAYSSSHGHLPPSNVLHPLPHPLQYQHQQHSSPQTSIATPTLWSSSFSREGPLPPPSPPGSRESAEGHPSSFPRPDSRARRGNSSPSIWQSMEPEPGSSTSSSAGPPSSVSRARSSSTVERAGSNTGGGRKKLPPAATKTLLVSLTSQLV